MKISLLPIDVGCDLRNSGITVEIKNIVGDIIHFLDKNGRETTKSITSHWNGVWAHTYALRDAGYKIRILDKCDCGEWVEGVGCVNGEKVCYLCSPTHVIYDTEPIEHPKNNIYIEEFFAPGCNGPDVFFAQAESIEDAKSIIREKFGTKRLPNGFCPNDDETIIAYFWPGSKDDSGLAIVKR